jgi:pimeloyl-ACP methyl ester carboxylesterase
MTAEPTTFGLVHASWHGPWCWDLLIPELQARGYRCVAPDLPAGDEASGARAYARIIAEALAGAPGDVVLVGHSVAGLALPLVPQLRPLRLLVYLCAFLPEPGRSMRDQIREGDVFSAPWGELARRQRTLPDGSTEWPQDAAIEAFYHDCPADTAAWAASRLRPQAWTIQNEVTPLKAWPAVASASVLCRGDRVVSPDWSRRMATERLGRTALELDGGHSPFLARPAELADLLAALATPSSSS